MEDKKYIIGISLYSDELNPEDYEDGQENTYVLTEEQYEEFNKIEFEDQYAMDEWFMNNIDPTNIYTAQEFVDEIAHLDNIVFDYHKQEYLEFSY